VLAFWNGCPDMREMFLRCAAFSNRRPESHPDYLVLFRNHHERQYAFVEVKSPPESPCVRVKGIFSQSLWRRRARG
jgi:hypothetical protein